MIEEFYNLTPRELNIHIKVYNKKKNMYYNDNILFCYYNAYFNNAKNPSLEKVLKQFEIKEEGQQELTDEDLFNKIKQLHSQMGGV